MGPWAYYSGLDPYIIYNVKVLRRWIFQVLLVGNLLGNMSDLGGLCFQKIGLGFGMGFDIWPRLRKKSSNSAFTVGVLADLLREPVEWSYSRLARGRSQNIEKHKVFGALLSEP